MLNHGHTSSHPTAVLLSENLMESIPSNEKGYSLLFLFAFVEPNSFFKTVTSIQLAVVHAIANRVAHFLWLQRNHPIVACNNFQM